MGTLARRLHDPAQILDVKASLGGKKTASELNVLLTPDSWEAQTGLLLPGIGLHDSCP